MNRPEMTFATLTVRAATRISPRMVRVSLEGDPLRRMPTVAPDQQVKLFFARDGGTPQVPEPEPDGDVMRWYGRYTAMPEQVRPWMRTYSLRRHDPAEGVVDVDFVLHSAGHGGDDGPGSRWAAQAAPGQSLGFYGPSISHFRPWSGQPWRLLVGDETALPAIGATVEALPAGVRAVVLAEVADTAEEQTWSSAAEVEVHWLHRGNAAPGTTTLLADAVREVLVPRGPVHVWVAGEASAVRAVRRHLVDDRAVPRDAVAFTGYWRLSLSSDDAPTAEEVAEQAESAAEPEGAG